jgi:hypothetical protein
MTHSTPPGLRLGLTDFVQSTFNSFEKTYYCFFSKIFKMKLTLATLLVLPLALAGSLKSVIITFPKGTPDSVVDQAKACLVASVCIVSSFS